MIPDISNGMQMIMVAGLLVCSIAGIVCSVAQVEARNTDNRKFETIALIAFPFMAAGMIAAIGAGVSFAIQFAARVVLMAAK